MRPSLTDRIVRFSRFEISSSGGVLLCFLFGFLVKLTSEVLSYPNLIGFDTIYYAARLKEGIIWHNWSSVFTETWLLYSLLIPIHKMTGLNPVITLKATSLILYGLNTAGIYYFANKNLKWKPKKSLLASVLFSFSLASLRISWDLYRNALGLIILLFTLPMISKIENGKKALLFILLSMLTVLAHELAAVTLLSIITYGILRAIKNDESRKALRLLALISPALTIFLARVYVPVTSKIEANIISARDTVSSYPLGFLFLTNYLNGSTPVEHYSAYMELALHILSLFIILYVVWLPLLVRGFYRDWILDVWTVLLLIGGFGPLLAPLCAPVSWSRWMLMLVYPFTFYAANGMGKILKGEVNPKRIWLILSRVVVVATVLMGVLFMALPANLAVFGIPAIASYFPSSMQQSTIPLQDVEGTVNCMEWLNQNMNESSCVLVHHAFLSWAKLHLDGNHTIIYYAMNLTKAIEVAQENGFREIYLIWWSQDTGWYPNIRVPKNFELTYENGRVGIYLCI